MTSPIAVAMPSKKMPFLSLQDRQSWDEKVALTTKAIQSQMPRRALIMKQPLQPLSRELRMHSQQKRSRLHEMDVTMQTVDKQTTDLDSITDVTSNENASEGKKSKNFNKYCRKQLD